MPVNLPRVAEEMDRALRTQERESVLAIRRYLEEAHRRLQRDVRRLYGDAADEVRGESRVFREARARAILAQLEASIEALRLGSRQSGVPGIVQDLIVLGHQEGPQQVASLLTQLENAGANVGAVGLASDVPWRAIEAQAANAAQRLTRYSDAAIDRINQAVIDGLAQGKGTREVQREIKKAIIAPDTLKPGERVPAGRPGGLAHRAETIARTEMISSLEDAREGRMRDAGVSMAMWVATDDDRVCASCSQKDGRVFRLDDVVLPAHPRCRCVTTPVRREWIEEGIIDVPAVTKHRRDTLQAFDEAQEAARKAGRKPQGHRRGPTPFERAAGYDEPPVPVWTPERGWAA